MIILEAYMAKTHSKKDVPIDANAHGVFFVEINSWDFHLVWIENDRESAPSDIVISYN
jgi:hypothetical protein